MVKIILFTDDNNEQLKLSQTTLDVLKRYVESQGSDEDRDNNMVRKEETNKCHMCGR